MAWMSANLGLYTGTRGVGGFYLPPPPTGLGGGGGKICEMSGMRGIHAMSHGASFWQVKLTSQNDLQNDPQRLMRYH